MHRATISTLREALFPPLCYACKTELSVEVPLCGPCQTSLNSEWKTVCPVCDKEKTFLQKRRCSHAPGYISTLSYITLYNHSTVRGLIHTLKYSGILDAVIPFADLLEKEKVNLLRIPADIIVPVPLHPRRERERGFNQAGKIAEQLSKLLAIPIGNNVLIRRRSAPPQARNKRREGRVRNVRGLFKVDMAGLTRSSSILLVDDVATSGSTLEEAARVLVQAGAGVVHAFALARDE
jgi:ComF family protein